MSDNTQLSYVCIRCKEPHPASNVYLLLNNGKRVPFCKPCKKAETHKHYRKNADKVKERINAQRKTPEGKATTAKVAKRAYERYPEKNIARDRLRYAVKKGKVEKKPCQECGANKTEAHHYKGYDESNWYNVIWLCRDHHRDIHKFSLRSRGIEV